MVSVTPGRRLVRRLLRPQLVISVIVSLAILAALFAFIDLPKFANLIGGLQPADLATAILLILGYMAVQGLLWLYLLDRLELVAPAGERVLAFIGANLTRYLPGGFYFQNYLLYETSGVDPAVSSVATTLIVLMEPAIALLYLFVLGIDNWTWLRWLIGIGLPVALLFALGLYLVIESPVLPGWLTRLSFYRRLADEVVQFRAGLARTVQPEILGLTAALTALYVLLEGLALYMVGRSLHLESLLVTSALAAYYFSLGVALIVPIFTNLGTLEAGGVGALIALGVSREGAVAMMVLDRALIIGLAVSLGLVASVLFRAPLARALRPKP